MQAPILTNAMAQDTPAGAEHQMDLVRSAITLLAGGGARRVTLVNLALSEAALRELNSLARASGVLLRATSRGIGSDIIVEASG